MYSHGFTPRWVSLKCNVDLSLKVKVECEKCQEIYQKKNWCKILWVFLTDSPVPDSYLYISLAQGHRGPVKTELTNYNLPVEFTKNLNHASSPLKN